MDIEVGVGRVQLCQYISYKVQKERIGKMGYCQKAYLTETLNTQRLHEITTHA